MGIKDYDDYIDYCYNRGYDPAQYSSYDDYIKAVIKRFPPVHYNEWSVSSQAKLDQNLTDFFNKRKGYIASKKKTTGKPAAKVPDPVKERKKRIRAKEQSGFYRARTKKYKGSVSKTEEKMIIRMEEKRIKDQKFTKTEQKFHKRAIMVRANQLQKEYKFSRSAAFKRAHQEFK